MEGVIKKSKHFEGAWMRIGFRGVCLGCYGRWCIENFNIRELHGWKNLFQIYNEFRLIISNLNLLKSVQIFQIHGIRRKSVFALCIKIENEFEMKRDWFALADININLLNEFLITFTIQLNDKSALAVGVYRLWRSHSVDCSMFSAQKLKPRFYFRQFNYLNECDANSNNTTSRRRAFTAEDFLCGWE